MSDQVRKYFFGNIFLDWIKIMLNTQEEIWLCKISTTEPFDPRMFPKRVEEKKFAIKIAIIGGRYEPLAHQF